MIKPWATVTSGSRGIAVLVSYYLCGRRCHLAFFHYLTPISGTAVFTDALVQLGGSAFPQICSLSSPCHFKDVETTFRQPFVRIPLWSAISRVLVSVNGQKVVWMLPKSKTSLVLFLRCQLNHREGLRETNMSGPSSFLCKDLCPQDMYSHLAPE